jgi:hypothetical protein
MRKPITKKMICRRFGDDTKIQTKFFGGHNITTPTGGDVDIDDDGFRIHCGGEDVYRAIVLLGSDAWGHLTVYGSNDHVMATMAHGEALGVKVTPIVKEGGAGCLRFFLATLVFFICLGMTARAGGSEGAFLLSLLVAWGVSRLLRKREERAERRRGQRYRYAYPRIHGENREASREDASREGWL